jgi:hypothetical protein
LLAEPVGFEKEKSNAIFPFQSMPYFNFAGLLMFSDHFAQDSSCERLIFKTLAFFSHICYYSANQTRADCSINGKAMTHLTVYVEDRWVNASPDQVVQMMFDGRVDLPTPTKASSQDNGQGPLTQFLRLAHYEELSDQLLHHLQAMYAGVREAVDPCWLRQRVKELCRWDWADPVIRSRLLWTAAWLEELTGSAEESIRYYNAYLQLDSGDSHLRALAHNNRGALLIRSANVEGVEDLALAAVVMELPPSGAEHPTTLPEACFNLLNLLNSAAHSRQLGRQVESLLVEFMGGLPRQIRERWLGPDPDYEQSRDNASAVTDSSEQVTDADELHNRISILTDPTFKRLNTLTSKLAAEAQNIVSNCSPQQHRCEVCCAEGTQKGVACRLRLWPRRRSTDVAGDWVDNSFDWPEHEIQYADYAEAASLLCAHEIPLALNASTQQNGK